MATEAKRLVPHFYHHPDHGPVCETRTGPEAGADTVIEKINDEHARLHPEEYARFVASFGLERPSGTALKKIPGVDDTLVSVLAVHGITSVEQFAKLNDSEAAALLPNGSARAIELRDTARLLMSAGRPAMSDIEAIGAAQRELEAMRAERDAALKLLDEASAKPRAPDDKTQRRAA